MPRCYKCGEDISRKPWYLQFTDGDQDGAECVFLTECACGATNMVVVCGKKMQIECTDPEEVGERIIEKIGE